MNRWLVAAAHPSPLAGDCARTIGGDPLRLGLQSFADGEVEVSLQKGTSVAGRNVLIVHQFSFTRSINAQLFELLLICHVLRGQRARNVVLMLPYFPYGRHDDSSNGPPQIAAIAQLYQGAGVSMMYTWDLHNPTAASQLALPVHSLSLAHAWAEEIYNIAKSRNIDRSKLVIISPDEGGRQRAKDIAALVGAETAYLIKERTGNDNPAIKQLVGEVKGKMAIIVDDIVGTAQTAVGAAEMVHKAGALGVVGCISHAVLTKGALEKLEKSKFAQILFTDTILFSLPEKSTKCRVVPMHRFIAGSLEKAWRNQHI